jgi:hypothetical protein
MKFNSWSHDLLRNFNSWSHNLLRNFNSWSHHLKNFNSWSHDLLRNFNSWSYDLLRNFNSWSNDLKNFNSWSNDILNKKMCIVHNWIQNEPKSQKMVLSSLYFPCQSNIYVMHVVCCRTVNNKQAGITILYKMVKKCA